MSEDHKQSISHLSEEIKSYLSHHPNAADNVEGIAVWWLQRQRYINSVEKIEYALEKLVSDGVLSKTTGYDGKTIYRNLHNNK